MKRFRLSVCMSFRRPFVRPFVRSTFNVIFTYILHLSTPSLDSIIHHPAIYLALNMIHG